MKVAHKPHVVFISYYFPPMGGGGVQRIVKFLKYWDFSKFEVSLLTVKSSYFYAKDQSLVDEIPAQLNVIRTGSLDPFRIWQLISKIFVPRNNRKDAYGRESSQMLRKIAGFLFIPDSRILWLPHALNGIRKLHRDKKIDLIVATMPPFTAGIIARFSEEFFKIPYLLDYRDSWLNNPYLPKFGNLRMKIQRKLERGTLTHALGFSFVNPSLAANYGNEYKFLEGKDIAVIRNGYDVEDFKITPGQPQKKTEALFKIGIIGTVYSQGNAPVTLLQAMSLLKQKKQSVYSKLRVIFLGKWTREFISYIRKTDCFDQLELHDYLPHKEALEFANSMDALALALHSNLAGSDYVTPGRVYEYLYLKKTILAMCPLNSDLACLIKQCEAGEVSDYFDVDSISEILENWISRKNSFSYAYSFQSLEQFDRRILTQKMMDHVSKCLEMSQ